MEDELLVCRKGWEVVVLVTATDKYIACVYSPAFDLVVPCLYIDESFVMLQEQIGSRNAKGFAVVWETNG